MLIKYENVYVVYFVSNIPSSTVRAGIIPCMPRPRLAPRTLLPGEQLKEAELHRPRVGLAGPAEDQVRKEGRGQRRQERREDDSLSETAGEESASQQPLDLPPVETNARPREQGWQVGAPGSREKHLPGPVSNK